MNKASRAFLYSSFIILTASFALFSVGCSNGYEQEARADDPKSNATRLRIEEAKGIMHVYEIRLHNVKVNAAQEDVTWANVRETFEKKYKSFVDGAISEKELRDA